MNRTTCHFIICIAAVGALAGWNSAAAQNLITANPADRADARAALLNPAVTTFQDAFFTLGSKILYSGVSDGVFDLRNSYFSVTTSNRSVGKFDGLSYGLQGQVLQTSLQNTVSMSALLGKRVHERIAVGINLGFMNQAYDRGKFLLEVEDDPALNQLSKWVFPELSFGVIAVPHRSVTLAFSMWHLTQPDIAVDNSPVRLPRGYSAGAAVGLGYFRALIGVSQDHRQTLPTVAFESFRPEIGALKIGFGREVAMLEGMVYVMHGVSLSYRYNYPVNELRQASSGSHELNLVFNFKKHRSLYEAEWLEPNLTRRPVINPATAFVVESVFDTLLMVDKYISRKVDSTITAKELADLPEDLFFSGDSLEPSLPKMGAGRLLESMAAANELANNFAVPADSISLVREMEKDHTKSYVEFLRKMGERMNNPEFRARLVVPPDGRRAYLLLKFLELYGPVTDRIEIAVRDSQSVTAGGKLGGRKIPRDIFYRALKVPADTFKFSLNLNDLRWGPVSWTFILEDAEGRVLLDSTGGKQILSKYIWDWRLRDGKMLTPGVYYYYLRWQSQDGQLYSSPRKALTVDRIKRNIAIEIARRKEVKTDSRTKAMIILN